MSQFDGAGRYNSVYRSALLAVGMIVGNAWGQSQAIVPADVSGQRPATPSAQVPQPGTAAQTPAAPAAAVERPAGGTTPVTPAVVPTPSPGAAAQGGSSGAPATQAVVPAATPVATPAAAPTVTPAAGTPIVPAAVTPAPLPSAAISAPTTQVTESAPAPESTEHAIAKDGNSYPVSEIKIGYKFPHPSLPSIDSLLNTEIRLGVVDEGYVAPRAGIPYVTIKLGEIGKQGEKKIFRSGIAAIYAHLLRTFNAQNIIGVFVVVDPADIDTGEGADKDKDNRKDHTSLQFVIVTSTVKQVRTVEIGAGSDLKPRVNDPHYDAIRANSPLQPPAGEGTMGDVLRKDELDDYRLRLNRVAGRRVDLAISGTDTPGQVYLDYLVSQSRPWYVYAQISNTGTSQTATWRERFGFVDNQLTGHDDTLSLDYSTAGFSKSHSVVGSYELPVGNFERLRDRVFGSWNEFTASDVGQASQTFMGNQWTLGDELIMNIYQHRELFVDAIGGVRFQSVENDNQTSGQKGKGNFIDPYLALRLDRVTDIATTTGELTLVGYLTDSAQTDVDNLGRTAETSLQSVVVQFNINQSIYLEPLIDPVNFANGTSTLAHELYFSLRGQYGFDYRLIPQAQDVAGGLYSVRGYPESVAAGDSVVAATAEYRFHVPRVFAVNDDPAKTPFLWLPSFKYSPGQTYGKPDWDLILRAFVDGGYVSNNNRQSISELDSSLLGVGVGMELQILQNFNLRVDYGVPLIGIPDPTNPGHPTVQAGDGRWYLSSTILY